MKTATALVFGVGLLIGGVVSAQPSLERFDRQLEQIRRDTRLMPSENVPIEERTFYEAGAFLTLNYLSLDSVAVSGLQNRGLREFDLTAYARLNLDGAHDFLVRGRTFYQDFNPGDSFDEHGDHWDGRVERAYYRFDLARYLASQRGQEGKGDVAVKVGRDLASWANGLTLSEELDGGVVDLQYDRVAVQLLAGVTPLDTVDFDSSRPQFDDHTKRGFFGALLSAHAGMHRPFVYALAQRDYNDTSGLIPINGGTDVAPTDFDYNSNYFGIGSTGALTDRLAYGLEAVYENGDTLSSSVSGSSGTLAPVAQTRDDISAWAVDLQLDYLFPDRRRTRASGEVLVTSGDSDRLMTTNTVGGNTAGTNDRAFNAFGLVNTGYAFAPSPSNITALRGGISTYPVPEFRAMRDFQIGTDFFIFAKTLVHGAIDEPTTTDRILGYEPDIYVTWQMTSDVALSLRYGAFIPGPGIVEDGKIRQFFYSGVTFAF